VVENALSFDFEEYFQVHGFEDVVSAHMWDNLETRLRVSTEHILAWLEDAGTKATFFVLGWNIDRNQELIRLVADHGHEVASHGWAHRLVYTQSKEEFFDDIVRAKKTLEDITGTRVRGYRAPSYSVTAQSMWALDEIVRAGYEYDSSIYPIKRLRYGIPGANRFPYVYTSGDQPLAEFPLSTIRFLGVNMPIASGAYLRLLPFRFNCFGIDRLNKGGKPAIVNIHTWELDPDQPRVSAGLLRKFLHYYNLRSVPDMFHRMLKRYSFSTVADCLKSIGMLQ
jgi:polysaccharide deacetylase family protein (PEP-CTERM system associated)